MTQLLEQVTEQVKLHGLNTKKNVTLLGAANFDASGSTGTFKTPTGAVTVGGNATFTGTATFQSTVATTGAVTPTGGIGAAGGFTTPTVFHSGGAAPLSGVAATSGATNASIVTTETYVCEVYVPVNATLTGVSVLNGTAVAGHINVGLANSSGVVVAQSATTVSASGTSTYQQVPFTATYAAKGPAKYFVLLQGDNTAGRYNAHTIGNFGATKVTSETYGTFLTTASYSTTTFTTAIAPVADVY